MPTELGNILRISERVSYWRYGLDALTCWPRLWLLLPDGAKGDLRDARGDLDAGARTWLWGALFLCWCEVSWWAIPIALLACTGAYCWMKDAARLYGDLVQATFDVYRPLLYKAARREMSANAAGERDAGTALSNYFAKGSDSASFTFAAYPPAEG
jgi:hypothetical protein